jgi:hypothetical protein
MWRMVPAWTLVPTLVVGLLMGVVGARLIGRPATSSGTATREPAEPPAAEPADPAPAKKADEVEAVVAELERRIKGRSKDS